MKQSADISNSELVILKALWTSSPLLSADIVADVQRSEDWHEKTIKTLLNRLVKKGAVDFQKSGRAYQYFPLIKQAEYQQRVSSSIIDKLFSGRVAGLVTGFAEQRKLSRDDVDSLKQIIAQWEQQQERDDD